MPRGPGFQALYDRDERRNASKQMFVDGLSPHEVATKLGVGLRTAQRYQEHWGLSIPTTSCWTPEMLRIAENLLDDCCPYAEVGRTLGIHAQTVAMKFPNRGTKGPPIGNGRHKRLAESLDLTLEYLQPRVPDRTVKPNLAGENAPGKDEA